MVSNEFEEIPCAKSGPIGLEEVEGQGSAVLHR
jgi:hypothetical protein